MCLYAELDCWIKCLKTLSSWWFSFFTWVFVQQHRFLRMCAWVQLHCLVFAMLYSCLYVCLQRLCVSSACPSCAGWLAGWCSTSTRCCPSTSAWLSCHCLCLLPWVLCSSTASYSATSSIQNPGHLLASATRSQHLTTLPVTLLHSCVLMPLVKTCMHCCVVILPELYFCTCTNSLLLDDLYALYM